MVGGSTARAAPTSHGSRQTQKDTGDDAGSSCLRVVDEDALLLLVRLPEPEEA
jgi:hypothetical protein